MEHKLTCGIQRYGAKLLWLGWFALDVLEIAYNLTKRKINAFLLAWISCCSHTFLFFTC